MLAHKRIPVVFSVADPTADQNYICAKVPNGAGGYRLAGASAVSDGGVASSGTDYISLKLQKVGVDGAASAADLTAALGGASSAFVAERPRDFVLASTDGACDLLEGEYIKLVYDETGTVAPGQITVFLELAQGVS